MDKKSILDKIPHVEVKTEVEKIDLYRLGMFDNSMFELVELKEGQKYPPHIHKKSEAKLHMIFGDGIIILDGKEFPYSSGKTFHIRKGMSHGFKVKSSTLFLSVQTPPIIDPKTNKIDVEYT